MNRLLDDVFGREDLSQEDRFLKEYILGKKWLRQGEGADEEDEDGDAAGGGGGFGELADADEDEDEAFLEQQNELEYKYNFRFEEPGGDRIQSHARQLDTVRKSATKTRTEKRKQREERKKAEAEERAKEVKQLKVSPQDSVGLQNCDPATSAQCLDGPRGNVLVPARGWLEGGSAVFGWHRRRRETVVADGLLRLADLRCAEP